MRIIEPHQLQQQPPRRKNLSRRIIVLLMLVVLSGVLAWRAALSQPVQKNAQPPPLNPLNEPPPPRQRNFSGVQFRDLYNSYEFPGTSAIEVPPAITGNIVADTRIRTLARQRGYRLGSLPAGSLHKLPEGFIVQPEIAKPWQELKNAAAKDGVSLGIVSGYRSIDEQRLIFLQRLNTAAVTIDMISDGRADTAVDEVLKTTSIPGYSRHHTGYALDLKCGQENFNFFANTTCFNWLSKNNYKNAKHFGWIPSYPPEVPNQGPDPEAWEYVWVGRESLLEASN
jgi:hypothetical protein